MNSPSRLIFWRVALMLTGLLAAWAAWQMFGVTQKLGIHVQTSVTWLAVFAGLGILSLGSFAGVGSSFLPGLQSWFERLGRASQANARLRWLAWPLLLVCWLAYPATWLEPYYGGLIAKAPAARLLLFWLLALCGAALVRVVWRKLDWSAALGLALLFQAAVHLFAAYLGGITDYPFALGWSETSRYYYPSLFVSRQVYGQAFPWPILHPALHFVLVPPYLFNAPLWFHRAWQIFLRFLLVGLIAPALLSHLKLEARLLQFSVGLWIFLYLFDLPLYLHLAVPVFVILWGFSASDDRRAWAALIFASVWSGLSRLNWYPVPGMLAAALYVLETPFPAGARRPGDWREAAAYLAKPALWVFAGTLIAFLSMQAYIALSGIANSGDFYTSLSSSLLWYRLWPNATYDLGVFPGIVLFSLPLWVVMGWVFARRQIHPLRAAALALGLAVLFVGGLFVSMKIGGGGDIHNMDAYAVALLVVASSLFFGRFASEMDVNTAAPKMPWGAVSLLVLVVVWFAHGLPVGFVHYDEAESKAVLTALQRRVDKVNAQGGEILFITQRHLISMHMLHSVTLIPEYEREELMEMAMADNQTYLDQFKAQIQSQRFAAIVGDPLAINLLGSQYSMGEENNAWVRFVARPVLCNYRAAQVFTDDHLVIYLPQEGVRACP